MHGGILQSNNLISIPELDLIVAAYSHLIYLFSIQQATITDKIAIHQHPIIHLHYQQTNNIAYSIDSQGLVSTFRLAKHKISEQLQRFTIGKKAEIKQARFRTSREADIQIIALTQEGSLIRHVGQFQYLIAKSVKQILLFNHDFIGISTSSNQLQILSSKTLQKLYKYSHVCGITSLQQYGDNLIVGDEKGKITILLDFLSNGQVKLKQKLQWHVHQVNSLKVDGSYLYSAGQEGVIVLWHLRENKKDFLPRIGSRVLNMQIESSKIYCFLGDNTIKSIDLNNDKSVLHYKVMVNPHGDIISDTSKKLIRNNCIRVSNRNDKIYLRSSSGRIQQIDLYNGINTQHNILNRNFISRLDSHLPTPHQITDICFTKDNIHLAVVVEGINSRNIKFYQIQNQEFKLVSKVENCHSGSSTIHLSALGENRFLSYSKEDTNIKIWKLQIRKKESMLQIQQYFWCCEYSISFRDQQPLFVNVSHNKIAITYEKQFILFNIQSKTIEGIYKFQEFSAIVAVLQKSVNNQQQFIVIFQRSVELVTASNNTITQTKKLFSIHKQLKFNADSIVYNQQTSALALLAKTQQSTSIFISLPNEKVTHLQIPNRKGVSISDIFWIKQRLIALDSCLYFYDLTHQKQLVQIEHKSKISEELFQTNGEQQAQLLTYDHAYNRYIQRQFRKDKNTIDKNSQILTINPSISTSFQMLAGQLFL